MVSPASRARLGALEPLADFLVNKLDDCVLIGVQEIAASRGRELDR